MYYKNEFSKNLENNRTLLVALTKLNTEPLKVLHLLREVRGEEFLLNYENVLDGEDRFKSLNKMETEILDSIVLPSHDKIRTALENPSGKLREHVNGLFQTVNLKPITNKFLDVKERMTSDKEDLVRGIIKSGDNLDAALRIAYIKLVMEKGETHELMTDHRAVTLIRDLGETLDSFYDIIQTNMEEGVPNELIKDETDDGSNVMDDESEHIIDVPYIEMVKAVFEEALILEEQLDTKLSIIRKAIPSFRTGKVSIGKLLASIEKDISSYREKTMSAEEFKNRTLDQYNGIESLIAITSSYVAGIDERLMAVAQLDNLLVAISQIITRLDNMLGK